MHTDDVRCTRIIPAAVQSAIFWQYERLNRRHISSGLWDQSCVLGIATPDGGCTSSSATIMVLEIPAHHAVNDRLRARLAGVVGAFRRARTDGLVVDIRTRRLVLIGVAIQALSKVAQQTVNKVARLAPSSRKYASTRLTTALQPPAAPIADRKLFNHFRWHRRIPRVSPRLLTGFAVNPKSACFPVAAANQSVSYSHADHW